ncbi:hypothetical protein HETIRDRAFT_317252 [Heterobasidion irregulare TC 32-1]|uniref:Uncharacterized protein n=1 Tax=Heterobasidion irregulare (strain TC 32-1) TaxID=747525 RepID=W4K7F7_HETIT|nr:uncharacterized protein HETIRDRAFT_317252 [Heterobasidion irregulare TC 32-1]ETW81733.1 hypothetical protein HETIRDRAFT_317252 [Heterobasidion irregulare TC 32-1]
MSYLNFDDGAAWSAPIETSSGDIVRDAMKKEQIIQSITAAQDDLRVLLDRVKSVEADIEKLSSGNATLQMYIDNLTMQMAKRR